MISVIIPTTLAPPRLGALDRAIASVRAQAGVSAQLIVVANGPRVDEAHARTLARLPGLRLIRRRPADLQAARLAGREAVDAPFFCFLDDDDEYLPGALAARLAPMLSEAAIDVVVGRGERFDGGVKSASGRLDAGDALDELITHNWLTACGALYRTRSIGREFFADMSDYFEWTLLAAQLCLSRRLVFVDHVGHLIHDTPGSLSKSGDYALAHHAALARMLQLPLPAAFRAQLRKQQGRALHDLADLHLSRRALAPAWRAHWQSLLAPAGWSFAAYTRKLLWASLKPAQARSMK